MPVASALALAIREACLCVRAFLLVICRSPSVHIICFVTQCWSDAFQFQLVTSRKLRGNKFTLKRHALSGRVVIIWDTAVSVCKVKGYWFSKPGFH